MSRNQFKSASLILRQLRQSEPKNDYVLALLLELYRDMDDWQGLRDILADVKRRGLLAEQDYQQLELDVYNRFIEHSEQDTPGNRLSENWQQIPKALRDNPKLLYHYGAKMIHFGLQKEVEPLLRHYLKRHWDEKIVSLYSQIDIETLGKNYNQIESLAQEHGTSPVLLFTLGKLCLKNKLWGKAKLYFESSIGVNPSVDAYRELGQLHEQMGESNAAMECYRKGMQLRLKQAS